MSATVQPSNASRSTPHARRDTASHQRPICQRADGARSRRAPPSISLCHRTRRFLRTNQSVLPARRRLTVDHSLVAGAAQRQWLQACLPDGHKPQCPSTPCPPVDEEVVARITQFAYFSAGRHNAAPLPVNVSRREGPPTFRARQKVGGPFRALVEFGECRYNESCTLMHVKPCQPCRIVAIRGNYGKS